MSAAASLLWTQKGSFRAYASSSCAGEGALLRRRVGAVIVVVQPDLPDGDALRRSEQGGDALIVSFAEVGQIGGMEARRKVQLRVFFRLLCREGGGIAVPAHVNDGIHPCRRGLRKQRVKVAVFVFVIEVCVRVDVHGRTILLHFAARVNGLRAVLFPARKKKKAEISFRLLLLFCRPARGSAAAGGAEVGYV